MSDDVDFGSCLPAHQMLYTYGGNFIREVQGKENVVLHKLGTSHNILKKCFLPINKTT